MKLIYSTAILAAVAFAASPAAAAMTCGSADLTKAQAGLLTTADGPAKEAMYKDFQAVNMAWSKGDMRACNKAAMKLGKKK